MVRSNFAPKRQPFTGRQLNLQIHYFVELNSAKSIYEAPSQADIVDTSLVGAGHTLPLRFEKNPLALTSSSLLVHLFTPFALRNRHMALSHSKRCVET
jgi:hypothetical protein